ncbi:hypothetical protein QR680_004153 [Steinernema hermaphroditum]|uniref:RING-type domain-containing protein n=1 Tax=Steinernema hermaphroditum TaxID=289476 RepID=A0AA39HNV3_9BILA|nr:hypothetical protein QR680_004153 [Steinernema hermaphroditum]
MPTILPVMDFERDFRSFLDSNATSPRWSPLIIPSNSPPSATQPQSSTRPTETQNETSSFDSNGLECPICCDVFTSPKVLSCCGQSLCQPCAVRACSRHCPFCRSRVNSRHLKDNVALRNFIETSNSQNKDTLSKCSTCNEDVDKKHVYSCTTCGAEENICPHCIIANHPGHAVQQRYVSKDCLKKIIAEVGLTEQICGNESESYLKTFENAQKKIQDVVTQLKRRELLTEKEARDKLDEIKPHVELIKKAQNMAQVFEAQLTNVNAHVD